MTRRFIMSTSILATKLHIPAPRPRVVLRPRLIERLDAGLDGKLTLISAAAGCGKTTLVSAWIAVLQASPRPLGEPLNRGASHGPGVRAVRAAWLSLDEGDSDPARFLAYLIAALQTVAPSVGQGALAALHASQPQPPPAEVILTAVVNDLAALPDRLILVLDDYHVLDAPAVDQALAFLLQNLPPHLHLVIATREDPPLPLARLRARGQLTELRAADLRFTPAEAAEFLNRSMGLNLSAEDIAALEARTEGWIAGLQLAAISMQDREDIAGFIQAFTGSHRFVLDYLGEEVLRRQPEPIRSFLLQTAILDRFCAPLCNAVAERDDGKATLDALERSNLFLIPLDDQRHWYRYHHLFADVLQTHLAEAQPDRVAALHRRASAWYERNGLRSDAIRHALAAQDFERAAGLIELAWPVAEDGSLSTWWLGWVRVLPDDLVRARPVLSVWYAYALLFSGEIEAAGSRLTDAERWLALADHLDGHPKAPPAEMIVMDEEQFQSLPARIAVARAYHAQALGDVPGTVTYARRALDLTPEADLFGRGQATALLGLAYWASGDLAAASRVFANYTMNLRAAGHILDAISTTFVLAEIQIALGRLHEALNTLEPLLQFVVNECALAPPDTADLYRELAELSRERGDLESAAQHALRAQELGEHSGVLDWKRRLCVTQSRMKQTQGDLDGALDLLNEAERLLIRTPIPDVRPIAAAKARIWVAQGRLTEAQAWVREQGLSVDDPPGYLREFEHITLARILIAQYRNDRLDGAIHAAMQLLDRLLQAAEEGGRMSSVIEILVLQALAHQARGIVTLALPPLQRALALAEPEGYIRIFVDEGQPIAELLERMKVEGVRVKAYLHTVLDAFGRQEGLHASSSHMPYPLIEPLSERELEVLRLLRTELSGPEIARALVVSLSTVRTHTQHLYAKLGVDNRRAAVRRAEELRLL